MGLAKKTTSGTPLQEGGSQSTIESGTQAALDRLKTTTDAPVKATPSVGYKQRDFDKEARGKTRCVQFEAALMSPAIAGMQWNGIDEYLALVRKAADAGVAYSFED